MPYFMHACFVVSPITANVMALEFLHSEYLGNAARLGRKMWRRSAECKLICNDIFSSSFICGCIVRYTTMNQLQFHFPLNAVCFIA